MKPQARPALQDLLSADPSGTHQESIRTTGLDPPDEFVHAETVHGLDRATPALPTPKPRWQIRYQDGTHERSAGIYKSPKAAEAVRKRIERGLPSTLEVLPGDVDAAKAQTLFGDYVEKVWWPTWEAQHPDSAYQTGKRIEKRILPFFGHLPFAALDADRVGAWKASLVGSGLKPASVNSYLSLLGTILNTAVDSDYLPHSPLMRKSRAGRVPAAKNLPVSRREVWVNRGQLDLLAEAIAPRYQALVLVAALTGLRFGELAALRWDDVHLDKPLNDGAVAGPGRLRVIRGVSDPLTHVLRRKLSTVLAYGGSCVVAMPRFADGPISSRRAQLPASLTRRRRSLWRAGR